MTATHTAKPYFPESIQNKYKALRKSYGERDSDIYVSSYSRSGTTWMQMILYQLTTDGSMDFDHLFDVSPWLYYSALKGTEPAYPPDPRILKTHDYYDFFDKNTKGRFVFVYRDGRDVLVSFYHHKINVKNYQGSFEQHFEDFLNNEDYNWFEHLKGWLENKNNLPILYIRYEDLMDKFDVTIQRIIDFCGIPVNEAILERTKERTSFDFMKQYAAQLGPKPEHFTDTQSGGYTIKNPSEFIRKGETGEGRLTLTPTQKVRYYEKFNAILGHLDSLAEYTKEA